MAKANLKVKEAQGRANLNVVTTNPIKTVAYNDINLKEWKNYPARIKLLQVLKWYQNEINSTKK